MVMMKEIVIGGTDPISCRRQINAVARSLWGPDALTENLFTIPIPQKGDKEKNILKKNQFRVRTSDILFKFMLVSTALRLLRNCPSFLHGMLSGIFY